jgi:hypothetical protein
MQTWSKNMPMTVNELTTEVIVETGQQMGAATPAAEQKKDLAKMRTELAMIMRLDLRTRAESFDD